MKMFRPVSCFTVALCLLSALPGQGLRAQPSDTGTVTTETHRFEPILVGRPHTWTYRGQIIPANKKVTVEAVITEIHEGESPIIKADGFLQVDSIIIYEMKDFGLRLVPAGDPQVTTS